MRFRLHVPFSPTSFCSPTKQTLADRSLSLLTILNPIYNMYNISTMTQRRGCRRTGFWGSFQSFYVSVTKTRQNSETRLRRAVHRRDSKIFFTLLRDSNEPKVRFSLSVCRPTTFPAILPFATNAGAAAAAYDDDDDDDYGKRGQLFERDRDSCLALQVAHNRPKLAKQSSYNTLTRASRSFVIMQPDDTKAESQSRLRLGNNNNNYYNYNCTWRTSSVNDGTRGRIEEGGETKQKNKKQKKRMKTQIFQRGIFPSQKSQKNFFFGEREASHYTIGVTVDSLWNPLLCCCFFLFKRGKPL